MFQIVSFRDGVLVKLPMVWMHELEVFETLVLWNMAVADDLHLRLVWDSLKIRVENAAFGVECLAMPVALSLWVETSSEFVLCFGRALRLAL